MATQKVSELRRFKGPAKWVQYLLVRCLLMLLQVLSVRLAWKLGRGIGFVCWKLMGRRRLIVRKNLEIVNDHLRSSSANERPEFKGETSFGSLESSGSSPDIEAQVREVFMRAGANLLTGFPLSRLGVQRMRDHLEVAGVEYLRAALTEGKGAIMLLAHMGPWEALAHLPQLARENSIEARLGAMYRPLNNFYLDRWLRVQREIRGTRLFSRREGFHKPVDFLRSGGILGVLADQKMREGPIAPYFGQEVPSSPISGLFHRRSGAPILALSVITENTCRWRLEIFPVEVPAGTDVSDRAAMAEICNRALGNALSQSPHDGFWFHKRF